MRAGAARPSILGDADRQRPSRHRQHRPLGVGRGEGGGAR
jgi:hypothetical protein